MRNGKPHWIALVRLFLCHRICVIEYGDRTFLGLRLFGYFDDRFNRGRAFNNSGTVTLGGTGDLAPGKESIFGLWVALGTRDQNEMIQDQLNQ